jgi:hypothetical protein
VRPTDSADVVEYKIAISLHTNRQLVQEVELLHEVYTEHGDIRIQNAVVSVAEGKVSAGLVDLDQIITSLGGTKALVSPYYYNDWSGMYFTLLRSVVGIANEDDVQQTYKAMEKQLNQGPFGKLLTEVVSTMQTSLNSGSKNLLLGLGKSLFKLYQALPPLPQDPENVQPKQTEPSRPATDSTVEPILGIDSKIIGNEEKSKNRQGKSRSPSSPASLAPDAEPMAQEVSATAAKEEKPKNRKKRSRSPSPDRPDVSNWVSTYKSVHELVKKRLERKYKDVSYDQVADAQVREVIMYLSVNKTPTRRHFETATRPALHSLKIDPDDTSLDALHDLPAQSIRAYKVVSDILCPSKSLGRPSAKRSKQNETDMSENGGRSGAKSSSDSEGDEVDRDALTEDGDIDV